MAHLTDTRPAALPLAQRISEIFATLSERIERYRTYRVTLAELRTLSNRDLEDLGIFRADIEDVAFDAAYRR